MPEEQDPQQLVDRALAGETVAVRTLVDRLTPVVWKRVSATLWRRVGRQAAERDAGDMVQEVFVSLFQAQGKALRAWDPARGMSLESFVALLAQHQVISILRSGRLSAWREEPTETDDLAQAPAPLATPEAITDSRETLTALLDRLRASLSPRGLELFQRLIINEEPIDALIGSTGMTRDALYQWKSRLQRTVRVLAAELGGPTMSEVAGAARIHKGAP